VASEAVHHWIIPIQGLPAPFGTLNVDTLIMVWVGIIILWSLGLIVRSTLSLQPSRVQVAAETLFDLARGITTNTAGKRGDDFLFYVGGVFLFIFASNLLGQAPLKFIGEMLHYPGELIASTGDFNTTCALGIMTLVMYFTFGLRRKGWSYFSHYIKPVPFLMPLHILDDITRPFTLMLRLFANIFAGEMLAEILFGISPYVLPVAVIFLELGVALLQAYIFAILSSVYISLMSAEDH
jgi:F-type H+-transporting ATPase subunit a